MYFVVHGTLNIFNCIYCDVMWAPCLHICLYATCMWSPWSLEEGIGSPKIAVNSQELSLGTEPGSCGELQVLLSAES